MASSRQIVDGFKVLVNDPTFQSRWYSDEGIVTLLKHRYHFSGPLALDYYKLNQSLARDPILKHSYNDIHTDGRIRYQQVRKQILDSTGKKRSAYFYYMLGNGESKAKVPTLNELQGIFTNNRLRPTRSSLTVNNQRVVSPIPNVQIDDAPAIQSTYEYDYFNSKEAKNIFMPLPNESVQWTIQRRLHILEEIVNKPSKVLDLIEDVDENNSISPSKIDDYFVVCCYLYHVYLVALEEMPSKQNWKQIIIMAIDKVKSFGMNRYCHYRSIAKWHRIFRVKETLPHPNPKQSTQDPRLFVEMPEIKERIRSFCRENHESFTAKSVHQFLLLEVIPRIVDDLNAQVGDDAIVTKESLLSSLGLKSLAINTVWRYLNALGYKHGRVGQTYYTDQHESDENRRHRIQLVNKYLSLEQRMHRWVQIPESEALKLEEDENKPLMKGIFRSFVVDGKTFREYHVDVDPRVVHFLR